jgi:ubiquinone/menaquinone biosynthesis C-methylase UbiE
MQAFSRPTFLRYTLSLEVKEPGDNPEMPTKTSPNRLLQFAAVAIIGIFVLGFVFSPLGAWTGAVLGAWFIGTQKPWRGFLLLAGINLILNLISNWRGSPLTEIEYAGRMLLAVPINLLPFLLYRLTSQRRQGFLSTLSLPLWGAALPTLGQLFLPASIFNLHSLAQTQSAISPLGRIAAILGAGAISFLIYWFAAVINWMWSQEFRAKKIAMGATIFGAVCVLVLGCGFFLQIIHPVAPLVLLTSPAFAWICFVGALILSAWSLIQPGIRQEVWANKTETIALLRSPYTGDSLHVVSEDSHEALVSQSGERFPVRNGIPVFLEPEKLTGSNSKYNRLYETIGGFYDDIQRVACALRGFSPDQYLLSYLRFLEVNSGDSVLETSVGTGLNYKYLPRGARLFGLDLSAEMLTNCQANLRRWEMDADLFLGNAEDLPFANDSFDVVFHVGGINFFNDRAKAIREMIRVGKAGSRMLIADETEEHVKSIYERSPLLRGYFKNRQEPVTAPIDLVPPEMKEIHLEMLRDGRFYALTFRKPSSAMPNLTNLHSLG